MSIIDEQIEVLNLLKQGKTIQYKYKDTNPPQKWTDCGHIWHVSVKAGTLAVRCDCHFYRAKPEPEVKWLNVYPDGSGTAYSSEADAKKAASRASNIKIAVKYQEVL